MTRVKGGPKGRQKHKKILKAAKGYKDSRSKRFKTAHETYLKAGEYAFAGRKQRKRDFRRLWIQRINAALTPFDLQYSQFINLLKRANIKLDRKILADLALNDPQTFQKIVETSKSV